MARNWPRSRTASPKPVARSIARLPRPRRRIRLGNELGRRLILRCNRALIAARVPADWRARLDSRRTVQVVVALRGRELVAGRRVHRGRPLQEAAAIGSNPGRRRDGPRGRRRNSWCGPGNGSKFGRGVWHPWQPTEKTAAKETMMIRFIGRLLSTNPIARGRKLRPAG